MSAAQQAAMALYSASRGAFTKLAQSQAKRGKQ